MFILQSSKGSRNYHSQVKLSQLSSTAQLKCKNVLHLYSTFLVIVDHSKHFYSTGFAVTRSHADSASSTLPSGPQPPARKELLCGSKIWQYCPNLNSVFLLTSTCMHIWIKKSSSFTGKQTDYTGKYQPVDLLGILWHLSNFILTYLPPSWEQEQQNQVVM